MSDSPGGDSPHRPNVILITFDSLAAQNMSMYGYDKVTTPYLDAFAKKSFVFKNGSANCNSTIPSMISILTAKYPFSHNCRHVISLLTGNERSENVASMLKEEGYHISAILGTLTGFPIVPRLQFVRTAQGTKGLKSHFFLWREHLVERFSRTFLFRWGREITRQVIQTNSSEATFAKALELLETLPSPFFLWIHVYPPHAPYLPPSKFKYAFLAERTLDTFETQERYLHRYYSKESQPIIDKLRSRYDELILSADEAFGTFYDAIKNQGYLENSMVIVTSDHGEMFEKGYQGHDGTSLYQPVVHIPLFFRMPNQQDGKVLTANAEHVDIAPTLMDVLGLKIPPWMEGTSLKEAMEQRPVQNRPNFLMSEDLFGNNGGLKTGSIGVTCEKYKLLFSLGRKGKEFYDLSKDPKEQTNLVDLKKEEVGIFERMIRRRVPASLLNGFTKG
jgi:arylsulfatase A-like enzyme